MPVRTYSRVIEYTARFVATWAENGAWIRECETPYGEPITVELRGWRVAWQVLRGRYKLQVIVNPIPTIPVLAP